jgi:hypothetical protein
MTSDIVAMKASGDDGARKAISFEWMISPKKQQQQVVSGDDELLNNDSSSVLTQTSHSVTTSSDDEANENLSSPATTDFEIMPAFHDPKLRSKYIPTKTFCTPRTRQQRRVKTETSDLPKTEVALMTVALIVFHFSFQAVCKYLSEQEQEL